MKFIEQLDHLVYAVPSLEAGIRQIHMSCGVQPILGGKHKTLGTHNALLGLSSTSYLEIIAIDPTVPPLPQKQSSVLGKVMGIGRTDLPKLTTWALRTHDLEGKIAKANQAGCRFAAPIEFTRETPEGVLLRWRLSFNEYEGPGSELIPFLIDWGNTPSPAERAPSGCKLLNFWAEYAHPEKINAALTALEITMRIDKGPQPKLIAQLSTPKGDVLL